MADAPPPLSEPFRKSAFRERDALIARYERCRAEHEELVARAEAVALEAGRYLTTIRELGELLGTEDQLSITTLTAELRGERLRQVAADIVFKHFQPGTDFHYKEWFDLVVAEGYRVGGKNASATFLTQVARIEGIEKIGRRTGRYRIAA